MFTARRGCYVERQVLEDEGLQGAERKRLQDRVQAFRKAYPWVKTYAPWNEANHVSQPTVQEPEAAPPSYYDALRKAQLQGLHGPGAPTCSTRATSRA